MALWVWIVLSLVGVVLAAVVGLVVWRWHHHKASVRLARLVPGVYEPVRVCLTQPVALNTWPIPLASSDGTEVNEGDRVLVRLQTQAHENGIYIAGPVWQRASDLCTDRHVVVGNTVFVSEGATLAHTTLVLQVIDVDANNLGALTHTLTFHSLVDMLLGTKARTPGTILTLNGEGQLAWQPPPTVLRGSYEMLTETWLVSSRQMNIHALHWDDAWLSPRMDSLWLLYVYSGDTQLVLDRYEILVSSLEDVPRLCVIHHHRTAASSSKESGGDSLNVECRDASGQQAWWEPQDQRSLLVHVENNTPHDAHCTLRLVRLSVPPT